MIIIPNEESDWVYHVGCNIHSPVLLIQRDNSDSEAKKNFEQIFKAYWTD